MTVELRSQEGTQSLEGFETSPKRTSHTYPPRGQEGTQSLEGFETDQTADCYFEFSSHVRKAHNPWKGLKRRVIKTTVLAVHRQEGTQSLEGFETFNGQAVSLEFATRSGRHTIPGRV